MLAVNAVDPGLTATDMMNGYGQPVDIAAATIAHHVTAQEPTTRTFTGATGSIPW
jgi:hypothetical protein